MTFRPNAWRRLKTTTSHRSVPLWPQLRVILERYIAEHPPSRLLFPSYVTREEAMVTDFRTALDAVAARALEAGRDPLQDVPAHLLYDALADA